MEEIDLKELLGLFLEKKILIIITIILFIILGFLKCIFFNNIFNNSIQNYSVAEMNLVVTAGKTSSNTEHVINKKDNPELYTINTEVTSAFSEDLYFTYLDIIKSNSVIEPIIAQYNLNITPSEFAKHITLIKNDGSDYIKIIIALNNDKIIDITNSLGNQFINTISKTYSLEDNIKIIDKSYIVSPSDIKSEDFDLFINALYPSSNINNVIAKNIIIFAFIGLILSCGYILVIESFDETIKNKSDINNLKLDILLSKKLNSNNNVLIAKLKEYKTISHINYSKNEASSSLTLAKDLSKHNKKVLFISLIENDQIISNKGLYDYIISLDNSDSANKSNITNYLANSNNNYLDILSSGNIDKDYIFDEEKTEKLLQDLKNKYDYIIVELDNIQTDVNSLLMLKYINNLYISCKIRTTNIQEINEIVSESNKLNINLLGSVLIEKD